MKGESDESDGMPAEDKLQAGDKPGARLRLADFSRRGIYYDVGGEGARIEIGLRRDGVFFASTDEDGKYDSGRGEVILVDGRGFFVGIYSLDYGDGGGRLHSNKGLRFDKSAWLVLGDVHLDLHREDISIRLQRRGRSRTFSVNVDDETFFSHSYSITARDHWLTGEESWGNYFFSWVHRWVNEEIHRRR